MKRNPSRKQLFDHRKQQQEIIVRSLSGIINHKTFVCIRKELPINLALVLIFVLDEEKSANERLYFLISNNTSKQVSG